MTWLVLTLAISSLIAIDLGLTRSKKSALAPADTVLQTGFWISICLAVGFYIYFAYEHAMLPQWLSRSSLTGEQALTEFISIFVLERLLGLDNLFMMVIVFTSLRIPLYQQYRVLFIGLLISIVVRSLIVLGALELAGLFAWIPYLLAFIIGFAALRMLAGFAQHAPPHILMLDRLQKILPVADGNTTHFFIRQDDRWKVTPLFLALICIELNDLSLASDSIPAALVVSSEPLIIISASMLSVFTMRAMYFVFAHALQRLRYIRFSLLAVLVYLCVILLIQTGQTLNDMLNLLVISLLLLAGVLLSIHHHERGELAPIALLESFNRIYHLTYTGFRRIIITLIGVSVLIVGIVMIVTPGPAIIVIPAGLAILASEFVWARVLLKKVKEKFVYYSAESKSFLEKQKAARRKHDDHEV